MALRPYPTELPSEALPIVIGMLRGQFPEPRHGIHCCEDVLAFGLGQLYSDERPWESQANVELLSRAELANRLEGALSGMKQAGGLPWGQIVLAVLELIAQLMKG